jgi:hypothetical protein
MHSSPNSPCGTSASCLSTTMTSQTGTATPELSGPMLNAMVELGAGGGGHALFQIPDRKTSLTLIGRNGTLVETQAGQGTRSPSADRGSVESSGHISVAIALDQWCRY